MTVEPAPDTILFLDANVLISAAWKQGSEVASIWELAAVQLITSNYVMGEVQRNLFRVDQIERLRILMRSVRVGSFDAAIDIPEAAALPEKDRPVLAAAIQGKANLLVSGDKNHFGPWYGSVIQGVRITAPSELLAVLRQRLP